MADNVDESKVNLTESLKKLEEIADWFENQQEVDVEAGLTKVKDASTLIADSKARLSEIENEFNEIERQISPDTSEEPEKAAEDTRPVDLSEIPF